MVGRLGRIVCATISTDRLADTLRIYEKLLGYQRLAEGSLDPALAAAWQAPVAAGSRVVQLGPPAPDGAVLRFVERPRPGGYTAMRTHGWNALEFLVRDPDGLASRLQAETLEMLGPPADLAASPSIRATQFRDPADVCVYFTRIGDDAAAKAGLPQARVEIDRIFVVVLGASDIAASIAYYEGMFGAAAWPTSRTRITVLSAAHALDRNTEHALTVLTLVPGHLIEVDQYPPTASSRPTAPGDLSPGVCIVSFAGEPGQGDYATAIGAAVYRGQLFRGPDGECIEIVREI